MIRRLGWGLLLCGLLVGCRTASFQYLGVPEEEGRITVDEWGNSTRIKPVRQASYFNFETLQRADMLANVQMEEEFIYYSVINRVPLDKKVSLAPGEGKYLTIIERYKVNVDERLRTR